MTTHRLHITTLAVVLLAAAAGLVPTGPSDARGATPVTVPCRSSEAGLAACRVVDRFFGDASRGRFAASCALLGARLRFESGGPSCPRKLASAYFVGSRTWAVLGVRRSEANVGVVVRMELPELDRARRLLWLATVGLENGSRRILATRVVGDLGSLPSAAARHTLAG
jgi:hypothetical protein